MLRRPAARSRVRSALAFGGVAVALVLARGTTACSSDRFSSAPGDGGAGRSTGGTSGAGGVAGSAGASGAGLVGMGGVAATAGTGAAGRATGGGRGGESSAGTGGAGNCACGAGEYCRAGTCYDCADLGQLDFGEPEEILDDEAGDLRFPRQGATDGALFFTRVRAGGSELWYLPELGASAPVSLAEVGTPSRAGLAYFGDPGGLGFDVLFDEVGADAHRSIHAAGWQSDMLVNATDAPSPLSAGGFDDYSVAFASTPRRAYWMTTRDGAPTLRTGTLGSGDVMPVDAMVPAQTGGGVVCPRQGDDATPWVTRDGKVMLLSALPLDDACASVDGEASDLYVALLDATNGMPRANATVAVSAVNRSTDRSSETDASFSDDLCTLYFASDGGDAGGHDFRLFRASRR
jgi:hypothetical protein